MEEYLLLIILLFFVMFTKEQSGNCFKDFISFRLNCFVQLSFAEISLVCHQ